MKCPGCGCNYMDDDKYCPMCEMPNNAFARAAHRARRARHEAAHDDCRTTTCAHPKEKDVRGSRRPAPQSTRSAQPKKDGKQPDIARIIKTVVGIFIAVNFAIPLLFGLLEFLFFRIF